jgi:hypothetical protein
MTGKAVLLDSRMLEKKWSTLVRMTTPTLHIDRFLLHHRMAHRSMRIVTTRACDFAFHYRVM